LKAQSRYKPLAEPSPESKLSALLQERSGTSTPAVTHSYEQGLLESILGAGDRKPSSASGSRSRGSTSKNGGNSGGGLFPSRGGNSGRVLADSISNRPADPLLWPPRSPRKNDPSSRHQASTATREQAVGSHSPLRNVSSSRGSPRSSDRSDGSSHRQRSANENTTSTRHGSSHRDRTHRDESAKSSSSESSTKEEKDLLASMASRLSQLEKASRSLRAELVAKDKQVANLTSILSCSQIICGMICRILPNVSLNRIGQTIHFQSTIS